MSAFSVESGVMVAGSVMLPGQWWSHGGLRGVGVTLDLRAKWAAKTVIMTHIPPSVGWNSGCYHPGHA